MIEESKLIREAKHVEAELKILGEVEHAQRVARLLKSHAGLADLCRQLREDNAKLRKALGTPGFLEANKKDRNQ